MTIIFSFIINGKYCDGIACVIGNGNMTVVWEDYQILGIITTDRKGEFLFQKACFLIDFIHGNRVFSCRCTEKMFSVRGQRKSGSGIVERILIVFFA